ncbi:MAG: hypothetical protein HFACDABA_01044 [Anaerolineales bacterium]|nr:hypothetical protein [Anaerolineales bacterium]
MSAFVVFFETSTQPLNAESFGRAMERLKHRGPDGRDVSIEGNAALGRWHFWVTPEESGERQPLANDSLPFKIVSDARLDNRAELVSQLGLDPTDVARFSDAALILRAYARWGRSCVEYFIGEFAFVIWDKTQNALFCARDALGERTLFYSEKGTCTAIASEPWAAAGAWSASRDLNEAAIAHFFALRSAPDGQTLFRNVYELPPAHGMWINSDGRRAWRYWNPDPSHRLRGQTDREYAGQFRALLEEAVRVRLRATTPAGILLSGGLDSGSLACIAAQMIAPTPLTAISYVFDQLTICDERVFIQSIADRWELRSIYIPCDDAAPFRDMDRWPHDPNHPEGNMYRLLKERAYQRASREGLRILLPGVFGDDLYLDAEDWLFDLVSDGRWRQAAREWKRHVDYYGWRRALNADYTRRIIRRLVDRLPAGKRLRRATPAPAWLRSEAAAHLQPGQDLTASGFDRKSRLLDIQASQASTDEIGAANRNGIELRHPYRDRRLIEFALSIPAYQLYNLGFYKYILRAAMQDILPRPVLERSQSTFLTPLFLQGWDAERKTLRPIFENPQAAWRNYVRDDWLWNYLGKEMIPRNGGPSAVVVWLCVSFEHWLRRHST